jgi:(p)ppGpp synthase/HD superfamily hydrolase
MGILLKRALDQAVLWHRDQLRKYPGVEVPYASHLAGVTVILARHGFAEEVLAAAALHDAVEDTAATLEDLAALFGQRVATLVGHVTEHDKSLPWEERKRQYLEHFVVKPWDAQAITLADKIDNLQSIVVCRRHHGDPWAQFKRGREAQLERFDRLAEAARRLPPHPLIEEYVVALESVRSIA